MLSANFDKEVIVLLIRTVLWGESLVLEAPGICFDEGAIKLVKILEFVKPGFH